MKRILTSAAICAALATPLVAQGQEQGQEPKAEGGRSLIEEGTRLFLEGLMRELDPALDELEGAAREMTPQLRRFLREMGPAFARLMEDIEDLSAYHPPEMLPNGDIILRRKAPERDERSPDPDPGPDGQIDI